MPHWRSLAMHPGVHEQRRNPESIQWLLTFTLPLFEID